jgi:cytochrome bd-type quinol oxidase subunit 1
MDGLVREVGLSDLFAARLQMAFTLGAHIVLACLGVGMPVLLLFAEWRYLRTRDEGWQELSRRWSKAFASFSPLEPSPAPFFPSSWAYCGLRLWRRLARSLDYRSLWLVASGPFAVLALQAGWIVTEVGRQPWIVQGIMRTADAVTDAPGIVWLLTATLVIYGILVAGLVLVLRLLARVPLAQGAADGT